MYNKLKRVYVGVPLTDKMGQKREVVSILLLYRAVGTELGTEYVLPNNF